MNSNLTERSASTKRPRQPRIPVGLLALAGLAAVASMASVQGRTTHSRTASRAQSLMTISSLTAFIRDAREHAQDREEREEKAGKKLSRKAEAGEENEEAGEILDSLLYRRRIRAFPKDKVDEKAYTRALEHIRHMPKAGFLSGSASTPSGNGTVKPMGGGGGVVVNTIGGNARWEFIGPTKLPTPYQIYYGPPGSYTSGRVNRIAYDPNTPGTVYLTGAQGGVWRTTDNGRNWTCLTSADNYPNNSDPAGFTQFATAIAVAPSDSNIIMVGTGDFDTFDGFGTEVGVVRSTDGGQTWDTVTPRTLPNGDPNPEFLKIAGQPISSIIIDPSDPNTFIVSAAFGLFRTTDGGQTWNEVTPTVDPILGPFGGFWTGLDVSVPDDSGNVIYYASCRGIGIFRSLDNGVTWDRIANLPLAFNDPFNPAGGIGLHVSASKSTPGTIYVLDASASADDGRVFRGDLHKGGPGVSWDWTDITGSFPLDAGGYNTFNQAYYDLHLTAVRGLDDSGNLNDMVYAGAISLVVSPKGGPDWTDISFTLTPNARTHNDQHGFAENPFVLYDAMAGNDGGIYGVTYNPSSKFWSINGQLSATLGITQFFKADWDQTNPNLMIGGSQDNATPQETGVAGVWRNVAGGDGGGCAINIANSNIQYATIYGGVIYRTTDNWQSSSIVAAGDWGNTNVVTQQSTAPFIGELRVSQAPDAPNTMYFGTQYLWRYTEGVGWGSDTSNPPKRKPMGDQQFTTAPFAVSAIAVAPGPLRDPSGAIVATAGNVVYVATDDGTLWVTANALAADIDAASKIVWTRLDLVNNIQRLPIAAITSISVNPNNAADILVGFGGTGLVHVFRCTNTFSPDIRFTAQGGFGQASLPDISLNSITQDPIDPENTWYVATDLGVFATSDSGSNWTNATKPLGLPLVGCNAIEAMDRAPRGTGFLNVATFGRGMWRIQLPNAPSPKIDTKVLLTRVGNTIRMQLTIINSGGQISNVKLNSATLQPDRFGVVNTSSALPILYGSLPHGAIRLATLDFPATNMPRGAAATYKVNISYGSGASAGSATPTGRTRLP